MDSHRDLTILIPLMVSAEIPMEKLIDLWCVWSAESKFELCTKEFLNQRGLPTGEKCKPAV